MKRTSTAIGKPEWTWRLTCASCSEVMYRTKNSRPQGEAKCRPCRREARGQRPKSDPLPPACKQCGADKPSPRHWYCEPCGQRARRDSEQAREQRKRTATDRGYGYAHQKARESYLAAHEFGDPCSRCHQPMWDDPSLLDLDHTDDRTGYLGLAHRACNRASGRPAQRIERVCDQCGLTFETRNAWAYLCGKACRIAAKPQHQRQPNTRPNCKQCGAECGPRRHAYCSDACSAEWLKVYIRNKYRAKVGIPLDAPLYTSAALAPLALTA